MYVVPFVTVSLPEVCSRGVGREGGLNTDVPGLCQRMEQELQENQAQSFHALHEV